MVGFGDAMRVGVHGTVRRVWGCRGVTVRQRVQCSYQWRYLVLVVDVRAGRRWWNGNATMQADELIPLVRGMQATTDLAAVVWDGAPRHQDGRRPRIELPRTALPPSSPELNPAERVFEERRSEIEGQVCATLDENVAAVEARLRAWDADPVRVQRLTGWAWMHAAVAQLPAASVSDEIAA